MMSKEDYQTVALVLNAELSITPDANNTVRSITYSLADVFQQDNPRFNREIFYGAVGI